MRFTIYQLIKANAGIIMAEDDMFKTVLEKDCLSILFRSSLENIDKVSDSAKIFLKNSSLDDHIFAVCLVLREGLSNAVRHAHHSDSSKVIKFILRIKGSDLYMEIEDEGEGFDWKNIISHLDEKEPDAFVDHGRGFKIMGKYFGEFWYNEKGNKLFLKKRI